MPIATALLFWAAASALGLTLASLLAFLIIRTAVLGAMKAHTRWERSGDA